jgi:hypothetical protein
MYHDNMALIRCPECASDVSDQAEACPNCGYPVRRIKAPADGVTAALKAGKKIEAIKIYRQNTGLGLKEAKDAVEQMESEMRQSGLLPAAAPSSSASGFIIMLVVFLLILAGFALWILNH